MTLEGANVFFDVTDYTIYTMNSATTGQYCVVLPKNTNGNYNMIVDLHMKNSFDSVTSGSKTKEQLIEEIKTEYTGVKTKYTDGILVIPMIDENLYQTAVINNDKQKMFDKVKKIGAITSEIYKKLTSAGIDKQKIDQKIIIIIKNNDDIKFVDWLKEQMPNFVIGVNESELKVVNNPFVAGENPFMPEAPAANDIFGVPVQPVEPTTHQNDLFGSGPAQQPAQTTNDIFNTPNTNTATPVTPVQQPVEQTVAEQVIEQPVVNQPVVTPTPTVEQTPPAPNPVQSTPLEATSTIQPVQNPEQVAESGEATTSIPETKGGKGFTNLIILLVVIAVVTFVSIQLGKFLYNTFGV